MNFKRYVLATLGLFVFIFLYEFFIHGFVLMGLYESTPHVWRDFALMEANWPSAMFYQFALSVWTAFAFTQIYKEGGVKNGLLFGLFFGVFAGILTASWYLWLPVLPSLSVSWFLSGIGEGLGGGLILGSIYRNND
jgi:hypothetical protein